AAALGASESAAALGASESAAALGASESAVAPGASESVAALGASESAAALIASESAAALGARASPATGPSSAEALHTFTLDSGVSRCFFRDCTTLTPLAALVPVSLADPTGGPVVARASTVLPSPAVPSGSTSGLHLPRFSTNLVSNTTIQDVWVDTFIPGGKRVAICTCSRTGCHLVTFTQRPGSSLYTLTTASAQVAEAGQVTASSQVSASCQLAASCSCRVLSHQTLLWHHRLGHPSLPRLHGMHSRLLVSGLPRSLPSLPRSPAPPCLPCVEERQRTAPHSSLFPPTTTPLQTLHMDVWGPAHVGGTDQECYFLLIVDDYTRYTTVFPLRRKVDVSGVLIPWIRATRRQLRERFSQDFPVLRLHSDRGGEFSSDLLAEFCRDEGIVQSFTLLASPQQNGIAERRIGLIVELNLWPRVSKPETSPTLRWTGKVGDASVFRVWAKTAGAEPGGAETEGAGYGGAATGGAGFGGAVTGDASSWGSTTGGADSGGTAGPSGGGAVGDPAGGPGAGQPPQPDLLETLSPQAICAWIVWRGSPGGGGYGPVGAGAASLGGTAGAGGTGGTVGGAGGAAGAGGTRGVAGARGAGATSPRIATATGATGTAAAPACAAAAAAAAAARLLLPSELLLPPALLLPPVLLAVVPAAMATPTVLAFDTVGHPLGFDSWLEGLHLYLHSVTRDDVSLFEHTSRSLQAPKAPAEPAANAGEEVRTQFRAAHTAYKRRMARDAAATLAVRLHLSFDQRANFRQVPSAHAMYSAVPDAADFGGPAVVGGGDAGGAGSRGARSPLVDGVGGTSAGGAGSGGALQTLPRRPIFLEQPSSSLPEPTPTCTTPPLLFLPLDPPLPAPARYVPLSFSQTGRREPDSCAASPAPSRVTQEPVVLPLPPPSSLPAVPDQVSDLACATRPTIPCFLAALVNAHASSPVAACALVAELAGFATTCCRAYLAGLVSASSCPPSSRGELALGCDVLEDRHFELEYLPYPLSIRTRYVASGRHHPVQWRAARRVLRYLVRLASRT
ncbi:unnamed protein product, partial [Closterium sp. NIES-53]